MSLQQQKATEIIRKLEQKQTMMERIEARYGHNGLTERVKAVINGTSKRKTGFTQEEVATLFLFDKEAHTGTNNFWTDGNGILIHYRTTAAIKTDDGTIIINRGDWSAGFARVTRPPIYDYSLNLSILSNVSLNANTIEILDYVENAQNGRSATLLKIKKSVGSWNDEAKTFDYENEHAYVLNAYDDSGAFIAELKAPCNTVKEAFASMKPETVRHAETLGLKVERQGELFFIPTELKDAQICDTKKRERTRCTRTYFQCQKCGIKTKPYVLYEHEPNIFNLMVGNVRIEFNVLETKNVIIHHTQIGHNTHPYFVSYSNTPQKMKDCDGTSEDMKPIFKDGFEYSEFPKLLDTTHTATKIGTYRQGELHQVAQGIIRHPQRQSLKLKPKKAWFIVAHNTVKAAYSRTMRGGLD